jgi:hypothetical protein
MCRSALVPWVLVAATTAALLAHTAAPADAQPANEFSQLGRHVGLSDRVRVRSTDGRSLQGIVTGLSPDTLVIESETGSIRFAAPDVREVAQRGNRLWWGVMVGFGAGFVLGGTGAMDFSDSGGSAGDFVTGGLFLGAVGAGVGALVGMAIPHHHVVFRSGTHTGSIALEPFIGRGTRGAVIRVSF